MSKIPKWKSSEPGTHTFRLFPGWPERVSLQVAWECIAAVSLILSMISSFRKWCPVGKCASPG